jgi:hypothetical protein
MRIIDNIRKFAANAAVHGFSSRRTWSRLTDRTGLKEDVLGLVRLIEEDKSGNDARLIEVVFQGLRCALAKEGYTSRKPNAPADQTATAGMVRRDVGKVLAKHQPCGCVVCTCEDDVQCHGCGAKWCGTHPVGEIPNPLFANAAHLARSERSER